MSLTAAEGRWSSWVKRTGECSLCDGEAHGHWAGDKRAHAGSMTVCLGPPRLWATWYRSAWVTTNWMTAFLWRLQMWQSYRAPWLTPPSCRHLLYAAPDWEQMKSSSKAVKGCQRALARMVSAWGTISHQAGRVVFTGTIRLSANALTPSSLKFTTSSQNHGARPIRLTSVPLLQSLTHPLTALKKKDTRICLLWMSPWPHISARPWWPTSQR